MRCWDSKTLASTSLSYQAAAYLVNEGGKLVVEELDLLTLLSPDLLDLRVDLHMEWGQQALVDGNFLNPSSRADREASTTSSTEGAPESTAKAAGTKTRAKTSSSPKATGSPEAGTLPAPGHADGDALVPPEVVEASAAEAPRGAAACTPRHGGRAESSLPDPTYDGRAAAKATGPASDALLSGDHDWRERSKLGVVREKREGPGH